VKAIAVTPGRAGSLRLVQSDPPRPRAGELLVRLIEAGICGTDLEIAEGLYGEGPNGSDFLILGHESLGVVETAGSDRFAPGDLVVATVRRPCPSCSNCRAGVSDMCETGRFTERGILGGHGFMAEFYAESPEFLVKVPALQRSFAVLLEPMSVVEKGIEQIFRIQQRMEWQPGSALVLGAGPIGLLATLLLRIRGISTTTFATRPVGGLKSRLVSEAGARYRSRSEVDLNRWPDRFDLIVEATGSADVAFDAINLLKANGVLCLTSVTGGAFEKRIEAARMNFDIVLGNKLVFGTVNANRRYFEKGVLDFAEIETRWPGILDRMITRRIPFSSFREAFAKDPEGVKTVLVNS